MSKGKPRHERLYRDPGEAIEDPYLLTRAEQDEAYQRALLAAIKAGAERCATSPSTHFGTRAPIAGYQRGDL